MNAEEKAYAAAWLAEMWKPCREWHQTLDEKADAYRRQQAVNGAGDEPKKGAESAA